MANKQGAVAVKLCHSNRAYALWKQCNPRLPLPIIPRPVAVSLCSLFPLLFPTAGLALLQELSQTEARRAAIIM
jgi:hypothetical protein